MKTLLVLPLVNASLFAVVSPLHVEKIFSFLFLGCFYLFFKLYLKSINNMVNYSQRILMKTLILPLITASLFATTAPLHVEIDIYSNKAFINKSFELRDENKLVINIPINTNIQNIRYALPKACKITRSSILKQDLKEIKNKREKLIIKIDALRAKDALLKTLSLEKTKENIDIENISNYLVKNLIKNSLDIKALSDELKEFDKSIKQSDAELKLEFTCKEYGQTLKISYPKNGIKYTPFYNISANIPNKSVLIEKKATLFFTGNRDFENVDLNIYSYAYNQKVAPQKFYPRYLGQKKVAGFAKSMVDMDSESVANSEALIVTHQNLATKSVYKIESVNLKSNKNNLLDIDKEVVDASFKTVIDAYGSNRAYLEAVIKTDKNYSSAKANFFLNQNPISTRHIPVIKKGEETKLYFGEDEHIQITKELIKTLDEKTFFGDKQISTQNWKYTITSKKPYSTDIEFIERVPVSKDGDIVVKTLAKPPFSSQSAKGKTIWNFKLGPHAKKDIIFGYEIKKAD